MATSRAASGAVAQEGERGEAIEVVERILANGWITRGRAGLGAVHAVDHSSRGAGAAE